MQKQNHTAIIKTGSAIVMSHDFSGNEKISISFSLNKNLKMKT